jgi:uncharacterized protein with ParB-like and HNH nuclease domain
MIDFSDRIKTNHSSITSYLESLQKGEFQIPTFQREVVWDVGNVKLLWDSIHKFYPLGSLLIWKTNTKLQNHKEIGGHLLKEDFKKNEYQYILDGQQRTTALLTSLYGGNIKARPGFKPDLYVDLTVEMENETDTESLWKRFLFWNEIDDRNGEIKANSGKKKKYDEGFIVLLRDVKEKYQQIEESFEEAKLPYSDHIRKNLRTIKSVLDNYRISFIELKGIKVSEVCQIFERINRAGKPLDIFDIVVAKTFRPASPANLETVPSTGADVGFYLREMFENLENELKAKKSNYGNVDYLTLLQMIAAIIRLEIKNSGVSNITDRYLGEIQAKHIEQVWPDAKRAILKTFDFLENVLQLKGPNLVPFRYYYLVFTTFFYKNRDPNYQFLQQYFWFYSFHNEDLLSNTGDLWRHVELVGKSKTVGQAYKLDPFVIDRNKLRNSTYSSKGRLARAILSLYANQKPRDWATPHRFVLADVYYILTDKPNLHHVFPLDFIENNPGANKLDSNSLMNIAYLTQITNLQISNRNPVQYMKDYMTPDFSNVLGEHLVPVEILKWAKGDDLAEGALDVFIEKRIDIIVDRLKENLKGVDIQVIDTKGDDSK